MTDIIIFILVLLLLIVAGKKSIRHFKGECSCSSSAGTGKREEKKLSEIRDVVSFHVDGMHCENCERRIEDRLNSLDGLSAEADFKKRICTVSSEGKIDIQKVRSIIEDLGYTVR